MVRVPGGLLGLHRRRFVLLIIDIFDDMAWTNFGTVVLIGIAVLLRPGGVRGPR